MTWPIIIVENIRLRERPSMIRFASEPTDCAHAWEFHLWEIGKAYCAQCGSLADAVNDPRALTGKDSSK